MVSLIHGWYRWETVGYVDVREPNGVPVSGFFTRTLKPWGVSPE